MKKIILLIGILLFASAAYAELVSEQNLESLGYNDFSVRGSPNGQCTYYNFKKDLTKNVATNYDYFVVYAKTFPEGETFNISVYFNRETDGIHLTEKEFKEDYARVYLPRDKLKEENSLKVCTQTGKATNKVQVFAGLSKIATYTREDFSVSNAFTKKVSNENPEVGEEFEIIVSLRNYGSKEAFVKLKYRDEEFDKYLEELQITGGETNAEKEVPKCQQYDSSYNNCIQPGVGFIKYTARAKKDIQMTLFPAIAIYKDFFGEEQRLESNRVTLRPTPREIKIRSSLLSNKGIIKMDESIYPRVAVKNEGLTPLYNVYVTSGIESELSKEKQLWIKEIMPNETRYIDFQVTPPKVGTYKIGCEVLYREQGANYTSKCTTVELEVQEREIDEGIVLTIMFLILAIGIFAYLHLD